MTYAILYKDSNTSNVIPSTGICCAYKAAAYFRLLKYLGYNVDVIVREQ